MQVTVKLSHLRVTARKARLVVDLIRGKNVADAQNLLNFAVKKSALPVLKLLNSAIASAKNDLHLNPDNMFVKEVMVNEGPTLKRWHPMSRGRAYPIMKRSAHIILTIAEINPTDKPVKKEKVEKVEKTVKEEKTVSKPKTIKKAVTAKKSKAKTK